MRRLLSSRTAGFTLVELLVVLALILLFTAMGFPALSRIIDQRRLTGYVQEASVALARGRAEAIQRGVPVVAEPDFDLRELRVWADVDGNLVFEPDPAATARTVDYLITRVPLPTDSDVHFWGPGNKSPYGNKAIRDLTKITGAPNSYVFEPNGSIRDTGGLRIGDDRGNYFELRAEPRSTGRVQVLKYHPAPAWQGGTAAFYPPGNHATTGEPLWVWF
ncbi:MAG TPA: prepilin-type N-terminal cleavage/methylation domain-containing protein [Thermoanaerobaculia bacterium]|nr:prepilin-type N-terminal cleavage/methylation domain-containing protein [Thermoanaerobaculia bacterium]